MPRRRRLPLAAILVAAGVAGALLGGFLLAAGGSAQDPGSGLPRKGRPSPAGGAPAARSPEPERPRHGAGRAPKAVERLTARVVAVHPHDPAAYTQGLLWHEGTVFESTGLYGSSSLRRWELATGRILARVDLPGDLFGEGLARVGDRLVQLTWREGRALVWDLRTLGRVSELAYLGEGWGLCFDGRRLAMSDGSAELIFRAPDTLAETGRVTVTLEGAPLAELNELECVGGEIYANVYGADRIVRIDPESGRVEALIDASRLLAGEERARAEVLNGIAFRPETRTFLLTGKLWPKLFEVELDPGPR
jgi:glutaminyl-peptide cyclotransferase